MRDERCEMVKVMRTQSVDGYELKKERGKGGEDTTGNGRTRMDRQEVKWNTVNKYCSLEFDLVTEKKENHIHGI